MSDNPIPLLPCPWCGSGDVTDATNDNGVTWIKCRECGARGPHGGLESYSDDIVRAIAAWNKGPYADREEAHAQALRDHANELTAKAQEHLTKAAELENKAANMRREALQLAGECEG